MLCFPSKGLAFVCIKLQHEYLGKVAGLVRSRLLLEEWNDGWNALPRFGADLCPLHLKHPSQHNSTLFILFYVKVYLITIILKTLCPNVILPWCRNSFSSAYIFSGPRAVPNITRQLVITQKVTSHIRSLLLCSHLHWDPKDNILSAPIEEDSCPLWPRRD